MKSIGLLPAAAGSARFLRCPVRPYELEHDGGFYAPCALIVLLDAQALKLHLVSGAVFLPETRGTDDEGQDDDDDGQDDDDECAPPPVLYQYLTSSAERHRFKALPDHLAAPGA